MGLVSLFLGFVAYGAAAGIEHYNIKKNSVPYEPIPYDKIRNNVRRAGELIHAANDVWNEIHFNPQSTKAREYFQETYPKHEYDEVLQNEEQYYCGNIPIFKMYSTKKEMLDDVGYVCSKSIRNQEQEEK